jgi:prephenate dehydrogenase
METLVVGAGAVGRWFADCTPDDVAFVDVDEAAAEAAAERAHRTQGRTARAVPVDTDDSFGLVCIAVPLPETKTVIERYAPRAQTAVIDLTGQMVTPLQIMASAAPARERASFHPLFAPRHAPGRVALAQAAPGPATDRVTRWLEDAGNDIVSVEPETHDDAMRTIQGRTHAAILAFGAAADPVPEELATPVYTTLNELLERMLEGESDVYANIQTTFGGADAVAEAAAEIDAMDVDGFATLFERLAEEVRMRDE